MLNSIKNSNLAIPGVDKVAVVLSHCTLDVDNNGKVTYFDGYSDSFEESLMELYDYVNYVWIAGCQTVLNLDNIWDQTLSKDDDLVLYPNTFSFAEMFHCGVLVCLYPDKKLQVLCDIEALKAYHETRTGKKSKAKRSTEDGTFTYRDERPAQFANEWYSRICEMAIQISGSNNNEVTDRLFICRFQAGIFLSLTEYFERKNKSVDELHKLILCQNVLPQYDAVITNVSIALTFRVSDRSDDKHSVPKPVSSDIDPSVNIIDMRRTKNGYEEYIRKETDDNEIIKQLRVNYRIIKSYNIQGVIGVHGGFIDILNVLGVPTKNSLRMFGKKIKSEFIKHWKNRTKAILKSTLTSDETTWLNDGLPDDNIIVNLLNNLVK
eukprot:gene18649-24391_t